MWLFVAGFFLMGIGLALLVFGDSLFGDGKAETAVSNQVPSFSEMQSEVSTITQGGAPLEAGDSAPEFILNDLDGNPVALSDFRGQPVILNFWATWCAPCRIEMPELQQTFYDYQDDNLVILALNQGESPDIVERFFHDELGLAFTPLLDAEYAVSDAYGALNLPTTFFINADGEVTAVHRGIIAREQLDGYLVETIQ